jgi:uncharacterized protein (TIGR02466 family)
MFSERIFTIGISKFVIDGVDNESLCNEIRHYSTNPTNNIRNPRGMDTNNPLLKDLNQVVLQQAQNIIDGLAAKPNNGVLKAHFNRMWGNHNLNSDICVPHAHRDSFLSAVYYPKSTDGRITFYCPWMDGMLAHLPHDYISDAEPKYSDFNSCYHDVQVKTGWLILFPAMLCHVVPPTTEERYSIVYDIGVKNESV